MKDMVNFLFEVGILKNTPRSGYQFLGSGSESVAEHSFRVAVIAYLLAKDEPEADMRKVLLMSLSHDFHEARTGDHNYVNKRYVTVDEDKAVRDLAQKLPFGQEIVSLIDEFNTGETIMELNKEHHPATSQVHSEEPMESKEATISLDTKDSTYHPYTKVIKQRIRNHWVYPLSARQNFIQGRLLIVFRLDRSGNLIDCNIAYSSGHEILDTHALNAIRSAAPFPLFPESITVQFLNIRASFAYKLRFE